VLRPADIETTALGAAYAAGLAVGIWTEETIFASSEAKSSITIFYPKTSEEERGNRYKSWSLAVERSFGLANLA
jgi:glycerol kinase